MACTRAVVVVLGTLFTLMQTEVVESGVAHAEVSSYGSGSAHSEITEPDGTIRGECAYLDAQGQSIKISYKQYPNGQVEAEADPPLQNATGALETCRKTARAASRAAQESIQQTQEEIFRQQQLLHQQMLRQNQAFQQAFQYPRFFGASHQFPFGPL